MPTRTSLTIIEAIEGLMSEQKSLQERSLFTEDEQFAVDNAINDEMRPILREQRRKAANARREATFIIIND